MPTKNKKISIYGKIIINGLSALGALASAVQNTLSLVQFFQKISSGLMSTSAIFRNLVYGLAVSAGGVCGGVINFVINKALLEDFFERISGNKQHPPELTGWRKFRYYAGITVFVITGMLFGACAFTIGFTSPLTILSVAMGLFVTFIMVIQEVETWLQSFDELRLNKEGQVMSLGEMFKDWRDNLTRGKVLGHFLAAGNVLALSLGFAAGLTEILTVSNPLLIFFALPVMPAFTGLAIATIIAFSFGAFTEFYFYNHFLAQFCNNFEANWQAMAVSQQAKFGFLLCGLNGLANAAGASFLVWVFFDTFLIAAGIALPPIGMIISLSLICGLFAGTASFILGLDLWIREMKPVTDNPLTSSPTSSHHNVIMPGLVNKGILTPQREFCDTPVYTLFQKLPQQNLISNDKAPHTDLFPSTV